MELQLNEAQKVYLEYAMPETIQLLQDKYNAEFTSDGVRVAEGQSEADSYEIKDFIADVQSKLEGESNELTGTEYA